MSIDLPGQGAVVRQPFAVGGWALDLAGSDNGIDVVHVYAYPATGAPPIFLGVAGVSGARPDVGGFFGPRFVASGYGLIVRGLQPGSYMIAVFAHSSYGAGFPLTKVVNVRVEASTLLALDAPGPNAILSQRFLVGGWAADFSAASGSGIDVVHVYAYPMDRAGAPIFLGQAPCNVRRLDVGAAFGAAYATSGFNLFAPALPPGRYQIVAYGRSLVTGTFAAAAAADILLR
jgi:hypothetical protein